MANPFVKRSRSGSRMSKAGVTVQRAPSRFGMTRTPAGVMSQIRSARYGASGLAAPQSTSGVTMPGIGSERPPAFDFAWNPATLRAVARGATAQGYAVRQMLQRQEEARARLRPQFERFNERADAEVKRLISTGRPGDVDKAFRLAGQAGRLHRFLFGE